MMVFMIIISYLLIGALIGWKDHVIVKEAIEEALGDYESSQMSIKWQKIAVVWCITLIILANPIMELKWLIRRIRYRNGFKK